MDHSGAQSANPDSRAELAVLPGQRRYKLISCEIIFREACLLAAQSEHVVDVEFLRKGLHDAGKETMLATIQEAVSGVSADDYDAVLLGYGRCNDGLVGLTAGELPVVLPRAHDCITFFFGSCRAYQEFFSESPGTYFRTTGWTERGAGDDDSVMAQLGLNRTYDDYVAQYGEENAKFIMESMGGWTENYKYLAYIEMGLELDEKYAQLAREEARERGWEFRLLKGDLRLLRALVGGQWDEDEFLVVQPGERVVADDDGGVVRAARFDNQGDQGV